MNDLPEIVLIIIFKKLDLSERLKLRLVCVKWKQIIESLWVKNVSIVESLFNKREKWNTIGLESIDYRNLLYYSKPSLNQRLLTRLFNTAKPEELANSLQLVTRHQMFAKLKLMFISLPSINNFRFEEYINPYFDQLEELACLGMSFGKTCLSLSKLKVLSMHGLRINSNTIKLELPSLYKFLTGGKLSIFEFVHPQSVTHLFLKEDDKSIVQFENLKYLTCIWYTNESVIFSNLSKLEEIHYDCVEAIQSVDFAAVQKAKQSAGRNEIKIIVLGINYEDYRLQNSTDITLRRLVQHYLAGKLNSPRILSFIPEIEFEQLIDLYEYRELPRNFKNSFSNIRSVRVSGKIEANIKLFFTLLDNYPNIYSLSLDRAFDGPDEQRYYNSLPFYCKNIRILKIYFVDQPKVINLRFIQKFGYLQQFQTNLVMESDFIRSLFETLKYLQVLELQGRPWIKITRTDKLFVQQYHLSANREKPIAFYSLSRMTDLCQQMLF